MEASDILYWAVEGLVAGGLTSALVPAPSLHRRPYVLGAALLGALLGGWVGARIVGVGAAGLVGAIVVGVVGAMAAFYLTKRRRP